MNTDHKFFGNYRAKVLATDVDEDSHLGRIKAEIYPMLIGKVTARRLSKDPKISTEGIDIIDLPWCMPATGLSIGSGSGIGTFVVPDVGTFVWVFFEAGDINQPVYFAEALTAEKGLPTAREVNYPQRRVIKFKYVEIIVDDEEKEVIINTDKDVHIVVGNDATVNAGHNVAVVAGNDVTVDAGRHVTVHAGDDVTINAAGKVDVDAGGNVEIDAAGNVNVNGATINLN